MSIYAIKFREKGAEKHEYISVLFQADNEKDVKEQLEGYLARESGLDVDRRTITWAGSSTPLQISGQPLTIYTNLDDYT